VKGKRGAAGFEIGRREMLCKISFEIDEEEEELLIYEDTTIEMVT
jgi:hypothetical protein